MPSQILHRGATVMCAHGAQASPVATVPRVTVSGQEIVTLPTPYSIAGCASKPPCATGTWISGASRVTAAGMPVVIFDGQSTSVPNGLKLQPLVAQVRVRAT
jgi:hypothetical protein